MSDNKPVEETKQRKAGRGKRAEGETPAEAKGDRPDQQRPKTAGRGRGRGRGGKTGEASQSAAAAQDEGAPRGRGARRPQTARQAAADAEMEETKGGERQQPKGDGAKKPADRKQREQKPQDKNSWIYKYHNMDRPQYEKKQFTADTVIPELPAKKDLLKEPTKAEFDREMAAQDNNIQDKRAQKDKLIKQKRLVREGGLLGGGDKTKKGELTERINEAKGFRATKRQSQDAMRDIVAQMDTLESEKRGLLKVMHSHCHTVEDVTQEIKDLERRQSTTSMSAAAEGKLIKEIDQLKASLPKAKRFSLIEPEIKKLKTEKNKIWGEIKVIKGQEDVLNKQMEEIRKELEQTNAEKDVTRAELDKLQEQVEKVEEDLTALYAKKDEKREAYWKGRYDYKQQRNEIEHIEWQQRQKDKVVMFQASKQEREQEREDAIRSMPHPYSKEIDCCEHLIGYMTTLKMRAGLIVDNEEAARKAQAEMQQEVVKEKINEKLAAGKVQVAQSKADRANENTMQIGGPRKQKGKKRKAAVEYEESFNLDLVIIKKFALLGIAAPVVQDDLDNRMEKVMEKKQWFEDNGGAKLQEQIDEMNRMADEQERQYEPIEEETTEESSTGRGRGRGTRGRGAYGGGRGGTSRGRGRGGLGGYQVRNEFEGEDDDDIVYSAPTNKPKQIKQKKEDLKMDEDNYPAL